MKPTIHSVQPVLMVRDVTAAVAFYRRLGFAPAFYDDASTPTYAGLTRDGVELHVQWHDAADFADGDRPTYRFVVSDVDALSAEFEATGIGFDRTPVQDTPWGTREFHLRDPDRNGLQFYVRLERRASPSPR